MAGERHGHGMGTACCVCESTFRHPVLRRPQCFVSYGQQNPRVHVSQRGVCTCIAKYRSKGPRNVVRVFVRTTLPVLDVELKKKKKRQGVFHVFK